MGGMVKGRASYHKKLARIKRVLMIKILYHGRVSISLSLIEKNHLPLKPYASCAYSRKASNLKQYDKAGERGKKKMEEQKKLHEDMAEDSNVKELSLRDVKRQCAAAYAKMGLKPSLDTLDLAKFREALKFLGCYLTDSRIIKLFRTADLDGGGDIDYPESLRLHTM